MVGGRSQLATILCVSLVSPTPPFPRPHHDTLQLRVRIFVIGRYRHRRRPSRSIISVYCSSSTSPTVCRGPDVLPDPKSSPAHNQRRFVIFCEKGLTESHSLNLLGLAWTCFVSNIESFFMTIRTKCPFVIEWIANTTEIWYRQWSAICPSTSEYVKVPRLRYECRSWTVPGPYIKEGQQVGVVCLSEKTFPNRENLSQGTKLFLWHQARFYHSKRCVIVQK